MKLREFAAVLAALMALAPVPVLARGGGGGHSGGGHHSSSGSPGYHLIHTYIRSNGTIVQRHYQTNANSTRNDNWSTRGNVNPFTGKPGDKPRDQGN